MISSTNIQSQTRYIKTVFDSVTKQTFTYSKIQDSILNLDLYHPTNATLSKQPLLILVYSGGCHIWLSDNHDIICTAKSTAKKSILLLRQIILYCIKLKIEIVM